MSILLKDFSLEQSSSKLYLSVPLKGCPPAKVDVFSVPKYLKIHAPPFFIEFSWAGEAEPCKTVFADGRIFMDLTKKQPGIWQKLFLEQSREERIKVRQESHEFKHAEESTRTKKLLQATREREREAISHSLEEDEKRRERLEAEKQKALKVWAAEDRGKGEEALEKKADSALGNRRRRCFSSNLAAKVARENKRLAQLPPPRAPGEILVTFSKSRAEKSRQDTKPAEEQDIKKDKEIKAASPEVENDLEYLLERGRNFFTSQDYSSAIQTFTHGVKTHPKHATFYNNRSACYLKVGNIQGALRDASTALELLGDDTDNKERVKAFARRGAALLELDLPGQALGEFEAALKIDPDHQGLRKSRDRIRELLNAAQ